jgi:hypothetical protein
VELQNPASHPKTTSRSRAAAPDVIEILRAGRFFERTVICGD